MQKTLRRRPAAYTLLEILVSLSILVIGIAAIFGISSAARKRAVASSDLAVAQLACHSTLNELLAREEPLRLEPPKAIEGLPDWKLQIDFRPAPRQGLYTVQLTARKYDPRGDWPAGPVYRLVRWVPEHRVEVEQLSDEIEGVDLFGNPFQDAMP